MTVRRIGCTISICVTLALLAPGAQAASAQGGRKQVLAQKAEAVNAQARAQRDANDKLRAQVADLEKRQASDRDALQQRDKAIADLQGKLAVVRAGSSAHTAGGH